MPAVFDPRAVTAKVPDATLQPFIDKTMFTEVLFPNVASGTNGATTNTVSFTKKGGTFRVVARPTDRSDTPNIVVCDLAWDGTSNGTSVVCLTTAAAGTPNGTNDSANRANGAAGGANAATDKLTFSVDTTTAALSFVHVFGENWDVTIMRTSSTF